MSIKRLKTLDMEIAVATFLKPRINLIVPNISWGLGIHECDLLVLTPAGFVWEVEIKVSKAGLIQDKEKRHGHHNKKIKDLYFAIPDYLENCIEHIPDRAGIILVSAALTCTILRRPKSKYNAYRFDVKEQHKMARLGAMRIWGLKRKLKKFIDEK